MLCGMTCDKSPPARVLLTVFSNHLRKVVRDIRSHGDPRLGVGPSGAGRLDAPDLGFLLACDSCRAARARQLARGLTWDRGAEFMRACDLLSSDFAGGAPSDHSPDSGAAVYSAMP